MVPSGPCTSLAETGYYTPESGRNTGAVSEIVMSLESNDSPLQSRCQTALLKLTCDYYYPPCNPTIFQQISFCDGSCESASLIQRICLPEVGSATLLNDVMGLDCSVPSSYLVENVAISQDQCINLAPYGMEYTS